MDIGFGAISGAIEWGHDRSPKSILTIMAAHVSPYVATTSIGFPRDMMRKVKKATEIVDPTLYSRSWSLYNRLEL